MIAISTGSADALECLALRLGIAPTEISTSAGGGHVHLYADVGVATPGATQFMTGWPGGSGATFGDARAMWNDVTALERYDVVMLSCEGQQYPATKPQSAMQAIHSYADMGGRLLMTHWHNIWVGGDMTLPSHGLADWQAIGTFDFAAQQPMTELIATVDAASPSGAAFAAWLVDVGASTTPGLLPLTDARLTLVSIDPALAARWVFLDPSMIGGANAVQVATFTTPIDQPAANRCGKVMFSDMHVGAGSVSQPGAPGFPSGCSQGALSPQERALAYLLFDLSACVAP